MPVAKVNRPERHVPDDLLVVRNVVFQNNLQHSDIRTDHKTSKETKAQRLADALHLAESLREKLQLTKYQTLVTARPDSYVEYDKKRTIIAEAGALVFRPMVQERDGQVTEREVIWVDNEHRPFSERAIAFGGKIAMEKQMLGGGWHVHRGANPNDIAHRTPRDEMLFRELATVTQLPIAHVAPSEQVVPTPGQLAPTGTDF